MAPPGFWMYKQGGELQPAIVAYLNQRPLTLRQIELIRLYLKQWIEAPIWFGDLIEELRRDVDRIQFSIDIRDWLRKADEAGIDPL
jgi:hypothetical protein